MLLLLLLLLYNVMLLLFSDNLAKAFYAWIQVRNIGAVEKGDVGRARLHYERVLQLKTFRAWLYSQVSYVLSQWKAQETQSAASGTY